MSASVNDILRVYLGATDEGGYQPVGCEVRLHRAFPEDHGKKKQQIQPYLDFDHSPDWSKQDLVQAGEAFVVALRLRFPELETTVAKALSNRFTYGHR